MKIAVLSRGPNLYSTQRLKQAIEARGHEAKIIDFLKCYTMNEPGKNLILYDNEQLENIDAVIPRIGAKRTFYGGAIVRQFELQKVFAVNSSQAILRSRDKLRSLQILARDGIGIPRTAFASTPSNIDHLIKQVGGPPLIIKLLEGTQGKGVVLAETKSAARSVLDAFYGLNANIIVQEFIKEAKSSDVRVLVINGKAVGAMKRTGKGDDFRSNLHRGGTAENIKKLSKEERKMAEGAAKAMGLKMAGVDLLQSERGPLIMEVNSSPGLEGIENATGKDIAGMIIQYIESSIKGYSPKDKIGH